MHGTSGINSRSGLASTQKQMHFSSAPGQLAIPWQPRTAAPPCRSGSAASSMAAPAFATMTTNVFLSIRARALWLAMPHRKSRTALSGRARPGHISKQLLSQLLSLRCRQPARDVHRRTVDQGGEDVGLLDQHGGSRWRHRRRACPRRARIWWPCRCSTLTHWLLRTQKQMHSQPLLVGRGAVCCACRPCWWPCSTRRNRCIAPPTRGTQKRMHSSRRRVPPRGTGAPSSEKSLRSRCLGNPGFQPRGRREANWSACSPCWSLLAPWPESKRRARWISVPGVLQQDAAAQEPLHGCGRAHLPDGRS